MYYISMKLSWTPSTRPWYSTSVYHSCLNWIEIFENRALKCHLTAVASMNSAPLWLTVVSLKLTARPWKLGLTAPKITFHFLWGFFIRRAVFNTNHSEWQKDSIQRHPKPRTTNWQSWSGIEAPISFSQLRSKKHVKIQELSRQNTPISIEVSMYIATFMYQFVSCILRHAKECSGIIRNILMSDRDDSIQGRKGNRLFHVKPIPLKSALAVVSWSLLH